MKRLIMMRHAKSDWSLSQEDHDRPLNTRGKNSAQMLGNWLRTQGLIPDQVLSSSAMRTRQTLDGLGLSVQARFEPALYLADPGVILDTLCGATGNVVLLLGHNPGMAMLAEGLVAQAPAHPRFQDFPTGATLVVDFDTDSWETVKPGTGRVVTFVIPKELDGSS
ncbi:SixA phosphatase family protein [Pelagimonas varians]|uniref:Phosphohistidine phosphatase n=1 Tax=Pelagimonas varians TaxID=696760 RepID=A0A238K613_9RHOB|nr:histidine phosphatase family protein [Pelagimonas varians]PYG30342.1 phosphohistidine phosphatase [Pelagimonas varians]SMX37907.1 phosphohistidine phosphatase [Pelagimonas varians]